MLKIYAAGVLFFLLLPSSAAGEQEGRGLCLYGELTIFSFKLIRGERYVSVCRGGFGGYLVYRFGVSLKNVELQFPKKLSKDSWRGFEFHGFSRGGGAENDAMGDYSLSFSNSGVQYTVFQGWRAISNEYNIGVTVDLGKSRILMEGDPNSQVGSLVRLEGNAQLSVD
jgi:hypothetical protein